VQIAKALGAAVTGVCSARNVDMVRSLGANQVIDYTQEDFTKSGQRYDAVFDCVGNHSLSAFRRVLNPKGICIIAAGPDSRWLGPLSRFIAALALSPFVSQKLIPFIARPNKEDLTILSELITAGKVIPVIDRCYSLSEVPAAIRYLEEGHARGKVVITLGSGS
jgi:NADPH:quinone reductase-like Zn-dependent oxidoreductase